MRRHSLLYAVSFFLNLLHCNSSLFTIDFLDLSFMAKPHSRSVIIKVIDKIIDCSTYTILEKASMSLLVSTSSDSAHSCLCGQFAKRHFPFFAKKCLQYVVIPNVAVNFRPSYCVIHCTLRAMIQHPIHSEYDYLLSQILICDH